MHVVNEVVGYRFAVLGDVLLLLHLVYCRVEQNFFVVFRLARMERRNKILHKIFHNSLILWAAVLMPPVIITLHRQN